MSSLSFELALLFRMPLEYRLSVLEEIGIPEDKAEMLAKRYPWPELARLSSQVDACEKFFGTEDIDAQAGRAMTIKSMEFIDHHFIPMLWPHLYWTVRADSKGGVHDSGFQNQAIINFRNFDPSIVRAGIWTLTTLERLAKSSNSFDGWDEHKVVRFDFDLSQYDGEFVFGLLTGWKKV